MARQRGIIATTDTGKQVRLAGPPKPERIGGRLVNPEVGFSPTVVKTRKPPPKKRPRPRAQRAGVSVPVGDRQRLSFLPGNDPAQRETLTGRSPYRPPAGPWRESLELLNERRRVEQSIRRSNFSGPLAYLGRTIQKNSQTAQDIITGLPGAAVRGVILGGTALRALGKDPTANASEQIEAAKTLGREGAATGRYYGGLAKDFATRPIWAFENRALEGALAAGLVWSGGGQALGFATRQARPVARAVRGAQQTGSVVGGVRVARAQGRAESIAADRARRARSDTSRPAGAPTPGGLPAASFVFRSADSVMDQAQRAAEVTGNVVGGPTVRRLERIADWGSKSTLEGSRRARDPRVVVTPERDRRGRVIGAVDAQGNPVGPRPEYEINRRPRSSNPLSRSVQRRVLEPAGAAVRRRVDAVTDRVPLLPDSMSRAVRASTRNMAYAVPETTDRTILTEAGSLAKMVGRLRRSSVISPGLRGGLPDSQVETGVTAAAIRAMGAAEDMGGSKTWGRDELITRTRNTLNDPNEKIGRRQRARLEQNLRTLEAIPDEWLDPTTAPKWLNELDGEARRLLRMSSDIKRQMGIISPGSAEWAGRRAQAQLLGARPFRRVRGEAFAPALNDMRLANAISQERQYRRTQGREGKTRQRFANYTDEALEIQEKALRRRGRTIRGRVKGYVRQAREDALSPYNIVGDARARLRRAENALAAARKSGVAAQLERATRDVLDARRSLARQTVRAQRTAYVGSDLPQRAGLAPGEYFPQRSTFRERTGRSVTPTGGPGTRWTPKQEPFNAAVLADRGDISFSPRQIVNALREAVDARERVRVAAAVITRFAVRDGDRLLEGNSARQFVDQMGGDGNVYSIISERQLARISALSSDTEAGQRLMRDLDESINPRSERVYAVPTAVINGWNDALGPAAKGGRWLDQINALWKGGVLALNPRWYFQNFFGMWGQFILGAGADLQAINMASSRAYLDAIPGRISAMGLSQDLGELARRMEGQPTNILGGIIRTGFNLNERLEAVPRRAMFWHAAKRGLRENEFIKGGVMDEGYLARAWLDVVEGAKRGDPGAERILDDVIVETERFMGNYSRYNWLEKNILRRIFPFYGWMRSINRLAFALPVKHPKRAAILSMASLMAYDMYGLERNRLTGYRSGMFVGGRQIGMNTLIGFQTTIPTFRFGSEFGRALEETRLTNPESLLSLVDTTAVDAFRSAAEQAGPLVGIPYTKVSGRTLAGIPLNFSPGYQGYTRTPTGQYERTNPATGQIESGTPATGFLAAAEQSFPLVNTLRNFLAGENRPYADASTIQLGRWYFGGRDPQRAPFLVANDPKNPRVAKTDRISLLSNFFAGVPADRIDPTAIHIQQAEEYKRMWSRLSRAERNVLLGEIQAQERNRRG